jgi:tripartite-type tricarboxylate transporter receptor subunit TctC
MITRRDLLTVSAASVAFSATGLMRQGAAQSLAKNVHVLTGFTPGLQDALARLITGQMKDYAETIIVEARPGAAGRVAVEAVKAADADGSVMLFAPLGFMMLFPHVYKTLRYEPRDFTPVSTVASTPTLLTVGPKVPGDVRTLADFVAWCRRPSKASRLRHGGCWNHAAFAWCHAGPHCGLRFSSRPLSRQWLDSGFAQRRNRIRHYANQQFPGPCPIRRSSCAGDHRAAPQPISP